MHKYFSDWYREIDLVPTPELLEKRAAAIDKLLNDIDDKEVLKLVCTLNHSGHCYPQFADQFAQRFFDADSTFPMRNNQNELRVLAGECLTELFTDTADIGFELLTAASIMSGGFAISSAEPPFADVMREAADRLNLASSELRAHMQYPEIPSYGQELESVLQKLNETLPPNNLPQVQLVTPLIDGLVKTERMLIELAEKNNAFAKSAQCRIETLAEECNVLWWLFSGYSHVLDKAFTDIEPKALPIIVAKELANLISSLPGPASVKEILARAMQFPQKGNVNSEYTISETINALPREWKERITEIYRKWVNEFPCIFPLHFAVIVSVELDGSPWDNAFFKRLDHLKSSYVASNKQISYQFYLESLILQNINSKE